jgi:hypothetical protein
MRSGGELTHRIRLVRAEQSGILEAAEQRDAVGAAKRSAEHLARTALMTLVAIDPRHEPARVCTALEHVYAEDPTADGASANARSPVGCGLLKGIGRSVIAPAPEAPYRASPLPS